MTSSKKKRNKVASSVHIPWTTQGPDSSNPPFEVHICRKFQGACRALSLWWSNHLDLHRRWSQRQQSVRHVLTNPLEHGRQPDDKTMQYKSLRMFTSHLIRKDVSWNLLLLYQWNLAGTTLPRDINVRRQKKMMFASGSTQVVSWSISAVDLSSVS